MIDRPVFIFGIGRSGTTLFLNVLAFHPDFAWFSNFSKRFPSHVSVAFLSRIHDIPMADRLFSKSLRYLPRPAESYSMLNYCTDSVFTAPKMLNASDVTESARRRYRAIVEDYMRIQGKSRFIQKHVGFARIRYLKAIFPDALFIHVYRDGRAIVNSMNNVTWWTGDLHTCWWWGDMEPEYMREYLDSGKEPIVLAGIVWKTVMDLIDEECAELPDDQLIRIRYDEMISDLPGTMRKVVKFCGLRESQRFERHVRNMRVMNMDTKWVKMLSDRQKELLRHCLDKHLMKYGFHL